MAKKQMKQVHGMNTLISPERQWEILEKFEGKDNPFKGKSRSEVERDIKSMGILDLSRFATTLNLIPTNDVRKLRSKILKKYDTLAKGLNRPPIQMGGPLVNKKVGPRVQKRLDEALRDFEV